VKKDYTRRLRMIRKSESRIAAVVTLAVPVSRYSLVSLIGD